MSGGVACPKAFNFGMKPVANHLERPVKHSVERMRFFSSLVARHPLTAHDVFYFCKQHKLG